MVDRTRSTSAEAVFEVVVPLLEEEVIQMEPPSPAWRRSH